MILGQQDRPLSRPRRWFLLGLGHAALGLAILGAALPLLPTTPFLLVAAWAYARANPRLSAWLHQHPRLGPFLRDWEQRGAIPRRAKACAAVGITASWVIIALTFDHPAVPAAVAPVLLAVLLYIVTRPAGGAGHG